MDAGKGNMQGRTVGLPCSDPKTQASYVFFLSAKVLRKIKTFAEEFCNFDGRSGLPNLLYFCYDISFAKQ